MKKAKTGGSAGDRPSSGSSSSSRTPSDGKPRTTTDAGSTGTNGPQRKNSGDSRQGSSKPLSKNLSKSHDNLASTLRKKAAQANLAVAKDNFTIKGDRVASPSPKFKAPRTPSTPIRKTQSTPHIDKSGTPIKRARSAQNISESPQAAQTIGTKSSSVKRASSTQNVSHKGGGRHVRISAPASAMAYNAELLASFEKEKKTLERRISELIQTAEERKTEIEKLKFRVKNLQQKVPEVDVVAELTALRTENNSLKGQLDELGVKVEHYTDSEKLSLLRQAHRDKGQSREDLDSAPGGADSGSVSGARGPDSQPAGSISEGADLLPTHDHDLGLYVADLAYITPGHPSSLSMDNNWDKQSNKSSDAMSEVSVACLQDRILQMEETHYSTNEELQATLQELGDLQDAVNELTYENERLADEKSVLLESLCAQTEKLENARLQIEHLKVLLVSDSEGQDRSENERQLVGLVKSAHEEKEELLLKQVEYGNVLHSMETENKELQDVVTALKDKTRILEMKNESLTSDKRANESLILELREQAAKDQIEIQRYKTLLENEKQKVVDLEQERNATDKSDLEALLATSRLEKEKLEEKLTLVQEQLAMSQNESSRHKEKIGSMEEEIKVCKNNAKTQVSDLEYKLGQVEREKGEFKQQVSGLRDHIDTLQLDCDRYLEDKKAHSSTLTSLEAEMQALQTKNLEQECALKEMKQRFREEQEEWEQFQKDLQTAVVIANNIKSETQEDMEQIVNEKQSLREENRNLMREVSRLKEEMGMLKQQQKNEAQSLRNDIRGRVLNTVDRELAVIRQGRKLSDPWGGNPSLSVKHLINSIETHMKTDRTTPPLSPSIPNQDSPRRNSTDSATGVGISGVKSDASPTLRPNLERRTSAPAGDGPALKSVLRRPSTEGKENRPSPGFRHTITDIILEATPMTEDTVKMAASPSAGKSESESTPPKKPLTGILANKSALKKPNKNVENLESSSARQESSSAANEPEPKVDKSPYGTPHGGAAGVKTDPLAILAKQMGGSKRNALLKWCQSKTNAYSNIDVTNFSSSWNDGLAFCAIMHNYLPENIPYKELNEQDKMRNFSLAFKGAESVGIPSTLNLNDMVAMERPDWQAVMHYITSIYKHFEVDSIYKT